MSKEVCLFKAAQQNRTLLKEISIRITSLKSSKLLDVNSLSISATTNSIDSCIARAVHFTDLARNGQDNSTGGRIKGVGNHQL
jgi:hypothetical protein